MSRYLILSTPTVEYAQAMSSALYALSAHPTSTGTAYAVSWVVGADGNVALDLAGDQYLQPTADIASFVSLLPITQGEAADLTATLEAARGARLFYVDMLPPSLQAQLVASFDPA